MLLFFFHNHNHILPFFLLLFFYVFLQVCQPSTCIILLPVFTLPTCVYDPGKICRICLGFDCTCAGACVGVCVRVRVGMPLKSVHHITIQFYFLCLVLSQRLKMKKEEE